eukprot:gene8748-6153_t
MNSGERELQKRYVWFGVSNKLGMVKSAYYYFRLIPSLSFFFLFHFPPYFCRCNRCERDTENNLYIYYIFISVGSFEPGGFLFFLRDTYRRKEEAEEKKNRLISSRKLRQAKEHRDVLELERALADATAHTYASGDPDGQLAHLTAEAQELYEDIFSRCQPFLLPLRRACHQMEEQEIFSALLKCQQADPETQLNMYTDMRDATALRERLIGIHEEAMYVLDTPQQPSRIHQFLQEKASYLPERTVSALMRKSRDNSLGHTPTRALSAHMPGRRIVRTSRSRSRSSGLEVYPQEPSAPWRTTAAPGQPYTYTNYATAIPSIPGSSGSSAFAGESPHRQHNSVVAVAQRRVVGPAESSAPASLPPPPRSWQRSPTASSTRLGLGLQPTHLDPGSASPWRRHMRQTQQSFTVWAVKDEMQCRRKIEVAEGDEITLIFNAALQENTRLECELYDIHTFASFLTAPLPQYSRSRSRSPTALPPGRGTHSTSSGVAPRCPSAAAESAPLSGGFRSAEVEALRSAAEADAAAALRAAPVTGCRTPGASPRSSSAQGGGTPSSTSVTLRHASNVSKFDIQRIRMEARLRAVLTKEEIDRRDVENAENFDRTVKLFPYGAKIGSSFITDLQAAVKSRVLLFRLLCFSVRELTTFLHHPGCPRLIRIALTSPNASQFASGYHSLPSFCLSLMEIDFCHSLSARQEAKPTDKMKKIRENLCSRGAENTLCAREVHHPPSSIMAPESAFVLAVSGSGALPTHLSLSLFLSLFPIVIGC